MPRKIAVIDCETDPFLYGRIPEPFLWGFYDGKDYREFENAKDLVAFLYDKKYIVYAHNGGKFDYHFMLDQIEPFSEIMLINGRLTKFKIGECEYRDSYNILPVPLANFNKTKIDYSKFEKSVRHLHLKEIREYLKDDCVYLYQFVSEFIDKYGINLTLASAAMKQWKEISGYPLPESDKDYYAKFSKYYYGGRVECFQRGELNFDFSSIDINSAYPFAMLNNHAYGTQHITWREKEIKGGIDPCDFYTLLASSQGALPFRTNTGLIFPDDREIREFTVTGHELIAGLKYGKVQIHKMLERHVFPQRTNFAQYVNKFYEIKKSAPKKSSDYIFAKLFMNSLYGKFAANPDNYEKNMLVDMAYVNCEKIDGWDFCGEIGKWGVLSKPLECEETRYYNVATAASITGFVRAYLFENIEKIRACGGSVLYCDTDSIAFRGLPPVDTPFGTELGEWEVEGNYSYGGIAGKKMYAFYDKDLDKWKKASKGVRLDACEIMKIAKGETLIVKADAPVFSVKRGINFIDKKIQKT